MQAEGEKGGLTVALPEIEHLKVNYRTHAGIINVAASVVDLIKRFFPQVCLASTLLHLANAASLQHWTSS